MHSGAIKVEVVRDEAGLLALEEDWRALERRVRRHGPVQSFSWARLAWQAMPKTDSLSLAVITVRRDGALVCVWPLTTLRHGRAVVLSHSVTPIAPWLHPGLTVATHLGSGSSEEYAGPLILEDDGARDVAAAALREVKRLADVIRVYHVPPDSAVARALERDRSLRHRLSVHSPVVTLRGTSDWNAWFAGKSKNFRAALRSERKKLAKRGTLTSVLITGGEEARELVAWVFETKRAWLAERGLSGPNWTKEGFGEAFFMTYFAQAQGADPHDKDVLAFAVKLDGKFVAANICLRAPPLLEYFVTSFDPAFYSYSPGNLLVEDCVTWAIGAGLDFDFRLTQDLHKQRWSDRLDRYDIITVAASPRGVPVVLAQHACSLAQGARRRIAPRIKPVLIKLRLLSAPQPR